jgi:acyl-CoA thioesterase I
MGCCNCINRYALAMFLILLTGPVNATSFHILVYGDSISAGYGIKIDRGWVNLLRNRLSTRDIMVTNASISGETTSGGLTRISQALKTHKPDLLILELGGNDALRGTKLGLVRENLSKIILATQQSGAQILLLGMQIPPNYGRTYATAFFDMFDDLATSHKTALVPFFMQPVSEDYDLMQADGIHPTTNAQPLLLEHIWPALRMLLPD